MSAGVASRRASTLRARLFRALAIACALPLAFLALVEVTLFARFDRDAARERMATVAARIARRTAAYVLEHRRAVESLAHLLAYHPMDTAETEEVLQRFRERYPGFVTMLVASRDGTVTAATPAMDPGTRHALQERNVADQPYFVQAIATERPFISSAFPGRGFGDAPIVAVSAPVRSAAGTTAVVEGSLDLRRLGDVVLRTGGLSGTEALIADAEGVVVFSSIPGVEPLARRPPDDPSSLVAHAAVAEIGWTAAAQVSRRAVRAQRDQFLAATAAAALLALALGFWMAGRQAEQIAGPLRELAGSLHSFEAGRGIDPPPPRQAPTEVIDLFDGFAALAGRLKVAHDDLKSVLAGLEQQVLERTETLRESEERFRQLADNIDVIFWVRSVQPPRLLYVSPAYETIWERPRSELDRDPMAFTDSIHPDDRERTLAAIAQQPLGPYGQEYRIVCPSGEVKWIRSIGFPIHDQGGAVTRIAGLSEDITESHRLEQMKQDLTHTMVHDLRSPLTGVQAGIEAAMRDDLGPALRQEALEIALRSVRKLLFLIDAILDVSRLESGSFPLERTAADLSRLASDVVASLQPLAAAKNVTLRLEAAEVPAVSFDQAVLARVVENLVGNAVKFTPAGGHVRVRLERLADAVRLSVSDDGPGIEPELSSRLFQKFVTGRRPGRGSGLGLAFCRLAVEAHGGAVGLETQPGRGATFHFTLPAAGAGAAELPAPSSSRA